MYNQSQQYIQSGHLTNQKHLWLIRLFTPVTYIFYCWSILQPLKTINYICFYPPFLSMYRRSILQIFHWCSRPHSPTVSLYHWLERWCARYPAATRTETHLPSTSFLFSAFPVFHHHLLLPTAVSLLLHSCSHPQFTPFLKRILITIQPGPHVLLIAVWSRRPQRSYILAHACLPLKC